MKRGDIVTGFDGWRGQVISSGKYVNLIWQSGPLAGREGRIPSAFLKVVKATKKPEDGTKK